jgi:hypothetical protein
MPVFTLTGLASAVGPVLTRQGAQDAARHELAKPGYAQAEPPWWVRPLRWIAREIGRIWRSAAEHTGGSAALSVLLLGIAVVIGLVIWRAGPLANRSRSRSQALAVDPESNAEDYRRAAEAFAAQGQWAQAVRERLRAVSRDLEERALVDRRPGRTAVELATEGGRSLPSCAALLREGADRFSAIWYGDARATEQDYRRLTEIDAAVRETRPVRISQPATTLAAP